MAGLTWLHLSDWHQKGKDFDRQVVRDALIRDIRNREKLDPRLVQVDLIVFSGDLAFNGKEAEYKAAQEYLFDPVLEATYLSPDRLFAVPGNHDLDRETVSEMLPPALQQTLNEEQCKTWLTDDKKRRRLLEPFEAFSQFISAYTGQQPPDYASIRLWSDIGGKKIALLGLNSAWMCGRNKDAHAIEPLIHWLANPVASSAVIKALGEIGNERAMEAIAAYLDHPEAELRRAALGGLAQGLEETERQLLSEYFHISLPLDPHEPIAEAHVQQAASKLQLTVEEVRTRYEALADRFHLRLAWRAV